jgi:glutaredoxin
MPRLALVILLSAIACAASAQELFRYVDKDGRVTYTDGAPPADAKDVQRKRLGANVIETNEPPYALQVAQQRNPVTLYSGDCGAACDSARALLNKRGVPFRDIDPSQPGEAQKMREITGDLAVPVLLVGSANILKGFEEGAWQSAIDLAGYPKTPATRINTIRRPADKAAAEKVAGKPPAKQASK